MASSRSASIHRDTHETKIHITLDLDLRGQSPHIDTGIKFFDHMLHQIARFSGFAISIKAQGDLDVDLHHTVEDVGIALGQAIDQALGSKAGIQRYADRTVPLDEALSRVVLDLSGRPGVFGDRLFTRDEVNGFELDLINEFLNGLATHGRLTIHADLLRGRNSHHQAECLFKAMGLVFADAVAINRIGGVPSTKGSL